MFVFTVAGSRGTRIFFHLMVKGSMVAQFLRITNVFRQQFNVSGDVSIPCTGVHRGGHVRQAAGRLVQQEGNHAAEKRESQRAQAEVEHEAHDKHLGDAHRATAWPRRLITPAEPMAST
ncbi:hypothetical protein EE612_024418 [Oryza sativa]|nr:hypothetical protein EE612_024418 [Oryza sativa]